MFIRLRIVLAALVLALSLGSPAAGQRADLPYWASIATSEANMRVGAGEQFPIRWVYRRQGLPLKVVRVMQGWRYVEDPDGDTGWILASLLSRDRTAIVTGEGLAPMREAPQAGARLRWNLQPGVVGVLGNCEAGWCEFDVTGRRGWVEATRLWGAGAP